MMDRSGTRTSVVPHMFAKVPCLKLRRDDTVLDSKLKIAALGTRPMAIEEIDSEEERQTRLKKKKETVGMDETIEIHKSHALQQVRVLEVPALEPAQEEKEGHRQERSH